MPTVGQILIKSKLPADLKHYADNPLDKKSMGNLLVDLSKKSSDVYRDVVTELTRLGYEIATRQGSSVNLDDLLPTAEKKQKMDGLITEVDKIKNSNLSKSDKEDKYEKLYDTATLDINKHILSSGLHDNKTLAKVILSGSRGSIDQYRRTVAGAMLVSGQNGPAYEMPITRSFSEGLSPAQYLLHTFDERQGAVTGKVGIADSGALAKSINRATLSTKIEEHDCGTHNGLPISVDNKDYIGSFLAHPVSTYNYNNEVTPVMLADLKNKHIKEIVVRTALTCEASKHFHHTALCALCVGRREKGIPTTGEFIGLTAGMGPAEASSQIVLGCLVEDTLVRMADFSTKKIKDIQIGDYVLGSDLKGDVFPTEVTNKFDKGTQHCYRYTFSTDYDLAYIVSTEDHNFLSTIKGKLQVFPIGFLDLVISNVLNVNCKHEPYYINSAYEGAVQTYDIEVAHVDALFVLANGFIVSNSKHGLKKGSQGGFKALDVLLNPPKEFKDHAPIARVSGTVKVTVAPQGGHYVFVNEDKYYIAQGLDLKVKTGDFAEKGTILSEGVVNPKEVTETLGVGVGRKFWSDTMHNAFKSNGINVNKRNFDVMARAAVDHVQITHPEGLGDFLPDEVVHYNAIAKDYSPRPNSKDVRVDAAHDKYLEKDYLHYTIGTPVTSSVIHDLKNHGIEHVIVNDAPANFTAYHSRLLDLPKYEDDWAAQLYSTYLKDKLLHGVNTGITSDIRNASPILGIAKGVGFGSRT